MNIKILKQYIIQCEAWGEIPSFLGLRVYNEHLEFEPLLDEYEF